MTHSREDKRAGMRSDGGVSGAGTGRRVIRTKEGDGEYPPALLQRIQRPIRRLHQELKPTIQHKKEPNGGCGNGPSLQSGAGPV